MENLTKQIKKKRLDADEYKKIYEHDHKIVKGIFRCFQPIGGSVTFSFKKYKGDDVYKQTMLDGMMYEVPLMVAKHINKRCSYAQHKHLLDANGNPVVDKSKKVKRFSFESTDFYE